MEIYGIKLVGVNEENGQKLLLTILCIVVVIIIKKLISFLLQYIYHQYEKRFLRFWSRQVLNLLSAIFVVMMVLSIWFDDPSRLATGLGLVTAGLAFALQKVVTSVAGYFIILRGNTFNVGERITMGGIRGDVIGLGFLQTTIMEMGQPPSVQGADPAMWIKGRQFTGRIVTVTNDKIFETPVYNYTRDFPFIWEEISVPIKYGTELSKVEGILLEVVARHVDKIDDLSRPLRENMEKKYDIRTDDMIPKLFYRITDNWIELTVRFISPERGIREIKSNISRDILREFAVEQIEIASGTFEIVGLPELNVKSTDMDIKSK